MISVVDASKGFTFTFLYRCMSYSYATVLILIYTIDFQIPLLTYQVNKLNHKSALNACNFDCCTGRYTAGRLLVSSVSSAH